MRDGARDWDRPGAGLLAATTAALHAIGCGIISATVQTRGEGVAENSFVVAAPDGAEPRPCARGDARAVAAVSG